MLPYGTIKDAEAALGRNLTFAESLWFHYSADKSDYFLYCHNILFLFLAFSLVPIPFICMELRRSDTFDRYKIQPKVRLTLSEVVKCYKDVLRMFFLVVGPLQLVSYPSIKWAYEKIHHIHHEFTAPIGFAAPYAHWAEILVLGIPSFLGPALVPGHMITFWLWVALRQVEAIETHCGYNLPWSPTKYIPFYGGAEYHDYHHYVGEQSHSNFASVFTYCDYIYGTDKGYQYHKKLLSKLKEESRRGGDQNGEQFSYSDQDRKCD
ncbi:hypothetical protein CRG98_030110 [Punica granatum]|uniref:Fatty acid hydroxylase domain-containing protein n=1 Tax=Punica granatum TaxID=22663 RepID=A0A2I0J0F6_PUNGR|nr:hypothetical protein CRG98_030110 [Punica granatum]